MTEQRTCPVCGKVLVRREGETLLRFRQKKVCDRECRSALSSQRWKEKGERLFAERTPKQDKHCVACNAPFKRRRTEPARHYLQRKTCSMQCRDIVVAEAHRLDLPSKSCVICGTRIERGDMRAAGYRKKKTCSTACAVEANRRVRAEKRRRKREATAKPKACTICGSEFTMRPTEALSEYLDRGTCSPKCNRERVVRMGRARRLNPKPKW